MQTRRKSGNVTFTRGLMLFVPAFLYLSAVPKEYKRFIRHMQITWMVCEYKYINILPLYQDFCCVEYFFCT